MYKIDKSNIEGLGLIADKDLSKGFILGVSHTDNQPSSEIGKYYNHSTKPNAKSIKIDNKRVVVITKPIKQGEEITLDYRQQPELEQPQDFKSMKKDNLVEFQFGGLNTNLNYQNQQLNTDVNSMLPVGFRTGNNYEAFGITPPFLPDPNLENMFNTDFVGKNGNPFGITPPYLDETTSDGLFAQKRNNEVQQVDTSTVQDKVNTTQPNGSDNTTIEPQFKFDTPVGMHSDLEGNLVIPEGTPQSEIDQLKLQSNTKTQYFNPFGGVSLENALFSLGQSIGYEGDKKGGNLLRGIGAAGKVVLSGARNIGAGMGYQNRLQNTMKYYQEQQRRALVNSNMKNENGGLFQYFKNGGTVKELSPEMALTGEYITGLPEHAEEKANAELEKNEYVKHPNGDVQKVIGKSHEQGGEKMNLESGTKIVSDNLTLGGDFAKQIRKEFDIKVGAKDTFASAIEKYTKKIGLSSLNEEQEKLFKKLKKEEETKDKATNRLNNEYLSKEIKEIEDEKKVLEDVRSSFVDFIFNRQEEMKGDETVGFFQNGGQIDETQLRKINDSTGIEFTLDGANRLFALDTPEAKAANQPINVDFGRFKDVNYFELGNREGDAIRIRNTKSFPHNYVTMKRYVDEIQKLNPKQEVKIDYVDYITQDKKLKEDQRFKELAKKHNLSEQEAADLVGSYKKGGWAKEYMQNGGNIGRLRDFYNQAVAAGYTGDIDFNSSDLGAEAGKLQKFLSDKNPQAVIDYFRNGQPITSKGIDRIKKEDATVFNELGLDITKPSASFTPEERVLIQEKLNEKGKFTDDFIIDQFQDNRWDYRFPQIPLQADIQQANIVTPEITADLNLNLPVTQDEEVITEEEQKVRAYKQALGIPFLPDQSTLPPDGLQPHLKINRRYERLDPVKISAEDNLKEIFRQENLAMEQINNLPDSQRRAVLTNLTANSQENANKAITATNVANAQNFQQTEQFNIGQSNKEEDARAIDALDFERRQLTALAKTQADLFNFFEFNRKVQLGNFNTVNRMNLLNDIYENYNVSPFGGIDFDSNKITEFYLNPTSKPASTTVNVSNNKKN